MPPMSNSNKKLSNSVSVGLFTNQAKSEQNLDWNEWLDAEAD